LFSIIFLVVSNGIGLLTPSVFFELPPAPGQEGGGLGNAIQGTALMVGIAILIAAPLGILSAIYISEYDKRSMLAGAVRFIAKLLTGIPSIICGMLGYRTLCVRPLTGWGQQSFKPSFAWFYPRPSRRS
jgi:phosphate transport system permease protein